jgi:hypothetical protein
MMSLSAGFVLFEYYAHFTSFGLHGSWVFSITLFVLIPLALLVAIPALYERFRTAP